MNRPNPGRFADEPRLFEIGGNLAGRNDEAHRPPGQRTGIAGADHLRLTLEGGQKPGGVTVTSAVCGIYAGDPPDGR